MIIIRIVQNPNTYLDISIEAHGILTHGNLCAGHIQEHMADALSRASLALMAEDLAFVEEVGDFVDTSVGHMSSLSATEKRLLEIQKAQDLDSWQQKALWPWYKISWCKNQGW